VFLIFLIFCCRKEGRAQGGAQGRCSACAGSPQEGQDGARNACAERTKAPRKGLELFFLLVFFLVFFVGLNEFVAVDKQMDLSEQKWETYESELRATMSNEEKKKYLLWFNSVINLMTQIDGLKLSCRSEYDRENRGRMLIKRCSKLLDKVDAEKAQIK
jgi:hypothetical protein